MFQVHRLACRTRDKKPIDSAFQVLVDIPFEGVIKNRTCLIERCNQGRDNSFKIEQRSIHPFQKSGQSWIVGDTADSRQALKFQILISEPHVGSANRLVMAQQPEEWIVEENVGSRDWSKKRSKHEHNAGSD